MTPFLELELGYETEKVVTIEIAIIALPFNLPPITTTQQSNAAAKGNVSPFEHFMVLHLPRKMRWYIFF